MTFDLGDIDITQVKDYVNIINDITSRKCNQLSTTAELGMHCQVYFKSQSPGKP